MELGVSAWTRRDRLERIASAERDRRAGRVELAIAVLGEGSEWPARVVMALARLPHGEGGQTREILEQSLDAWAAECGLEALGFAHAEPAPEEENALPAQADTAHTDIADADAPDEPLAAPIEHDELERAFAQAEAQTDEMHDVNSVAERVLLGDDMRDDITDENADAGLVPVEAAPVLPDVASGVGASSAADRDTVESDETDAAWGAAPIWPEPRAFESFREEAESLRADFEAIAPEREIAVTRAIDDDFDVDEDAVLEPGVASGASRTAILATLERWLVNLEKSRAGRAE